jgi:hypothetical protein
LEKPILENPTLENPMLGFPTLEKPTSENRMQLNKDISNTYPKKKKEKNTDTSNPNQSNIHPSIPEATEPAAQTTWMNDGFIVDDPILEEPTTVSPLRREADSLTEQQKFLSEPTSIPGMRRRLSFDGLVKKIKEQIDYWDLIENIRFPHPHAADGRPGKTDPPGSLRRCAAKTAISAYDPARVSRPGAT